MRTLPILSLLMCVSLLVSVTNTHAAKFYKWTDENGNVHFSDKEPISRNAETVHVNAPKPSQTAHQIPKLETGNGDPEEALSEEAQKRKQAEAEELQKYCKGLLANIKTMELSGRIQSVDEEGNRKFLEEDEIQQKLNTYRSEYNSRCQS